MPRKALLLLTAAPFLFLGTAFRSSDLPVVEANDNRRPAGRLEGDTLRLDLVVQMARWYPEAADGPFAEVAAVAERGKAPQIPAPLIRVPEGTIITADIENTLSDSTIWVGALSTKPATAPDSIPIKPGEKRTIQFPAGKPGTYLYYVSPGIVNWDIVEREQMSGAFVIDPPGARTDDRILMINIWGEPVDSNGYRNAVAINGKSWPHTERFAANVGDRIRWRVINGSMRDHPMHLHGFYFNVRSKGSFLADTVLPVSRLVVTENLPGGDTMMMDWTPDRPGNWLFHCHLAFHVLGGARLDEKHEEHGHASDPIHHMAGLVIGITVDDPHGRYRASTSYPKKLRLFANERQRKAARTPLHMSYVQQRGAREPSADSVEAPGTPIVLTKNQPVEVTVVNRTHASTSVHWHGIELESYSDGVAGWSGAGTRVAPMIAPRDSFTARLLLPRAGTFIYHTHLNDIEQLTSGAYGPIIVLEPGEKYDPAADHVFTLGWDGDREPAHLVVNGDSVSSVPLVLQAGRKHRFRFVNIGPAGGPMFALRQDSLPVTWVPRAKDGADLPAALRVARPATYRLATGETFDAEWTPTAPGKYLLTYGPRKPWRYSREVIVRRSR